MSKAFAFRLKQESNQWQSNLPALCTGIGVCLACNTFAWTCRYASFAYWGFYVKLEDVVWIWATILIEISCKGTVRIADVIEVEFVRRTHCDWLDACFLI